MWGFHGWNRDALLAQFGGNVTDAVKHRERLGEL
jgi:hypothetical protein